MEFLNKEFIELGIKLARLLERETDIFLWENFPNGCPLDQIISLVLSSYLTAMNNELRIIVKDEGEDEKDVIDFLESLNKFINSNKNVMDHMEVKEEFND